MCDFALLTFQPVVTVLVYLTYRRYPNSWVRYINVPIFFNAAGNIPPANTTQYSLWFIVGFVFNYLIRKRAFDWWKRYNCETLLSRLSATENISLIHDTRRFAPGSHGYRHCYRDDHHFLRAGLPRYHFQLVGKHGGIQYGRCEFRPLVNCPQRELFRKGAWRVLIENFYMNQSYKSRLGRGNCDITPKKLKYRRARHFKYTAIITPYLNPAFGTARYSVSELVYRTLYCWGRRGQRHPSHW
jgi:hypothetical protein